MWRWGVEDYSLLTGPFAVQEYIQVLIRNDPSDVQVICERPVEVDLITWQYEHLRQFVLELNLLVVSLQPVCTCPKMKGTDQQLFLCASHKPPQECSALDYMTHTLDHVTALLLNNKLFASRHNIPQSGAQFLVNIVRRLYRFFTHSYFAHRDTFLEFERTTHLCARFSEFSLRFKMMPADQLCIPSCLFKHRN